jgi:G3E family GTPase
MTDRVPFTILTGWLGAGKTTALNRMLGAPHGRRIAVLVNELGRIAIDSRLILGRGGDVLELAGGCICCKVDLRSDLWDGIGEVVRRSAPEHVVLETTGIAEPAAILDGLDRVVEEVRARILPAGVVCVVDGEAGAAQLDRRDEAREQVIAADRVMLSKLDVAAGG